MSATFQPARERGRVVLTIMAGGGIGIMLGSEELPLDPRDPYTRWAVEHLTAGNRREQREVLAEIGALRLAELAQTWRRRTR